MVDDKGFLCYNDLLPMIIQIFDIRLDSLCRIKIEQLFPVDVMRIEISKNVEFQSDPILMLLCFVIYGVTHENFMRELCLFYKALNDLSRYARSSRDLMMYLVEMCIIMILLYEDLMTRTSRRDLDITTLLYDYDMSSRSHVRLVEILCGYASMNILTYLVEI